MKSCGTCRERDRCVKVCAQVEARLPKEYTGRDTRRELPMDAAALETVGFEVTVVLRSGADPAPEMVLKDIRTALCGARLGLDIGPVMLLRGSLLHAGGHTAAYSALYALSQDVPDGP